MGTRNLKKWSALINAARRLIREKGFDQTSLADIAAESGVPIRNFYHYFRTKQAVGEAVVKELGLDYQNIFKKLNSHLDPKLRLILFLQSNLEELKTLTNYGCELGNLTQELSKKGGVLAKQTIEIFEGLLIWCQTQFSSLGYKEEATQLAHQLISGLQGAYLLAQVFKNPTLLRQQINHIQTWLENLIFDENQSFT